METERAVDKLCGEGRGKEKERGSGSFKCDFRRRGIDKCLAIAEDFLIESRK